MRGGRSEAWTQAVQTFAHLTANGRLADVTWPGPQLVREQGEHAVADISVGMTYERYLGAAVHYIGGKQAVAIGSAPFVTGFALGSAAGQWLGRRRARRLAAAQWRATPLHRLVLTTKRIWCQIATSTGLEWKHFNLDTIAQMHLDGEALVLGFRGSEPLRLAGAGAPWCAAVIAHFRYGPHAAAVVPALATAAQAS